MFSGGRGETRKGEKTQKEFFRVGRGGERFGPPVGRDYKVELSHGTWTSKGNPVAV